MTNDNVISVVTCRLHSVGRIHSQSMLLCIAVHGSKLPLCLSMALPFAQTTSVLLPSIVLISPSTLMFLFTFVVSKIIEAPKDLTVNEVVFQNYHFHFIYDKSIFFFYIMIFLAV